MYLIAGGGGAPFKMDITQAGGNFFDCFYDP
jgi:hypothetical protein